MNQEFVWDYGWEYLSKLPRTDMTLLWERDTRPYLNLIWVF